MEREMARFVYRELRNLRMLAEAQTEQAVMNAPAVEGWHAYKDSQRGKAKNTRRAITTLIHKALDTMERQPNLADMKLPVKESLGDFDNGTLAHSPRCRPI